MTEQSPTPRGARPTYASARDLPSFREMSKLVQGAKVLTRIVARDQREAVRNLEQEMMRLVDVVDGFYARLGDRNWIFHELLNPSVVEQILAETSDPAATELRLIELYRDRDVTKFWHTQLRQHEGLRARVGQIERAAEHYSADQFSSCTLQLIAVMDGFVNDYEPDARKGLAAREPDDMAAWDSVVGHHQGLTNVMKSFRKTIKKRIDDEVYEVYRHGIVHGMVVNFDNVVVATKSWNMLFAVADWATATRKAAAPAEAEPTWSDLWTSMGRHAKRKRAEEGFIPTTLVKGEPSFAEDDVVGRAGEFLDAWQHGRWALVADFMPQMLRKSRGSAGERARGAKDLFSPYELGSWEVEKVIRDVLGGATVRVAATVNGSNELMQFRMILEDADGSVGVPGREDAMWRIGIWAPRTYFGRSAN